MDNYFWTVVGTTAAVGVAALMFWQLRLIQTQLRHAALEGLHSQLISKETQEALRIVYSAKPPEFVDSENLRLLDAAEHVLNLYDTIGHRIKAGVVPKSDALELDWPTLVRLGQQLTYFVREVRSRRGTDFKEGFTWMMDEIRQDNGIRQKIESMARRLNPGQSILINEHTGLPTVPVEPRIGYRNSRPCVAVFVVVNGSVLLVRRSRQPAKGTWDVPGGFLNESELPSYGAVRELREETGIAVDAGAMQLLDIHMGKYDLEAGYFWTMNLCYSLSIDSMPTIPDHEEFDQARWMKPSEVPQPGVSFPWIQAVLDQLSESGRSR